jgi:multiple sugar transport system substrate-binding protein
MHASGLSRRSFLKGMALSVTGVALAACAAPTATQETGGATQEAVELVWHHRLGGYEVYGQRIQAFEEDHPDVKIVVEEFPQGSAEYGPKIVSLIAAGIVGDMTWTALGSGSYQFLMQNNGLAPLDDFIEADSSGFSLDEYYPNIVASLRFGGQIYGLPELAHGVNTCLYFNRDAIEAEGLEAPTMDWTHEQLVEMAIAMTNADRFGFLPAIGDYSNIRNQTLPYGGELLSEDGTTSLIPSDGVKEGLRWVYDLFYGVNVAPTPALLQGVDGGTNQMFLSGRLVSFQSGGWNLSIAEVVGDAFQWDMVLMPKGPSGSRGGHLHIDAEAVTQQSDNKQLAYEFCKYLTDKEGAIGVALETGLACRPDVYEDERINNNPYVVLLGQANAEAHEHINPANLRKQEMQTTVRAIFDPLWVGDAEPTDDFFDQASATFQEFLDKSAE